MYQFPKGLYADIRMEESYFMWIDVQDGDIREDSQVETVSAMIRVFDGNMWYTATTSNPGEIQRELDSLAQLATPDPAIAENPVVKKFEVHRETLLQYEKEADIRSVPRERWKEILDGYVEVVCRGDIPEIGTWFGNVGCCYSKKSFYSSKGAEIIQDYQNGSVYLGYGITVDGVTTYGGKYYLANFPEGLLGHEKEMLQERDRYLEYAKTAVDLEPGDYTCVLSPITTALFTHESFGHKSEADYMLHDKTLQEEWIIGKKVGNEKVSICDRGDWLNHGYAPYDDEGTKARETWLIREGVLTGRLHDAKSAVALGEELTGNARAQDALSFPMVRMTNTFMQAGTDDPERIIQEVEDGVYIYNTEYGTGMSIFTMKPSIAYRIRGGRLCEPVRINVLTGSVFQTLFDIDAVGNDYELFDTFSCGKNGQSMAVAAGGPTIRVKKLTVN